MAQFTRRQFLETSAATGAFLFAGGRVFGANDRIRLAVAGLHGRGNAHVNGFLKQDNVEIAYIVDPDQRVLAKAIETFKKKGLAAPKAISDIRVALDDKNLDAITVATPNHWHSLMTIWGAQAGKHVYVEKPMSHDVSEGRAAVEAQRRYGVVVQHGTQLRSDARVAGLHEAIHAGKFGRLKIAYGYCCKPRKGIGHKAPSDPPKHLDWNLWRGPAKIEAYHANYVHYNWHWFWNTGNGDMNNQGTHQLDVARWAIDPDQTHPIRAMALGGRFQWDDQGQTPNTMFGMAEYPNGQYVYFNVRNVDYKGYQRQVENEYYFEDGGKIIRNVYYPKGATKGEKLSLPEGKVTPGGNWGSFIAAVRAKDPKLANGNVNDAHLSCVVGHLMNNSYRLGAPAPFDVKSGKFGDNAAASEHFAKLHDIMKRGVGISDQAKYTVGPLLTFDPKSERHLGDHADLANRLLEDDRNPGFGISLG